MSVALGRDPTKSVGHCQKQRLVGRMRALASAAVGGSRMAAETPAVSASFPS